MNWLLLRGLARQQGHWADFPAALGRILPEDKLHFLDLPGTGTENGRNSPASIPAIVSDLRSRWLELARAESEIGPWSVIGISLGGMAALDWCSRHPGDFSRAVVINTSALNLGAPWERFAPSALLKLITRATSRDIVAREKAILQLTSGLRGPRLENTAQKWAALDASRPISKQALLAQLWAASRFEAPAEIGPPLLVASGGTDRLVSPRCSARLAALLGAPLLLNRAAGHDLPLDDPEWLADQIAAWSREAG